MQWQLNNSHLSLFSGIGGLDLAAEWAGFRTVAFVERDKYCQRVLAKHWHTERIPVYDDIESFIAEKRGWIRPTIISGGWPCQPFSHSGRRMGKRDVRHLWPLYLKVVEQYRPTWVVGENVVGIKGMELDNVLADLESLGYSTRAFDIPACAVGAFHERRRIFVVAYSPGERQQKPWDGRENPLDSPPPRFWETNNALDALRRGDVPVLCREDDGIPYRVERLHALGNAVVPQQAYPIFKAIAEIEGIHV